MFDITIYKGSEEYFSDFILLATGTSDRQIDAVATKLIDKLKKQFKMSCRVSGANKSWIVVDCAFAIFHLMTEEKREYYRIDELMADYGNVKI